MKKRFIYPALLVLLAGSCHPKGNTEAPENRKDSTDTAVQKNYFPVADYIKGEITEVDSLPVGIMQYTTTGRRTDSAYVKATAFHALAAEFLPPELLDTALFHKEYSESSFLDQSTNSFTFTYSTKNGQLALQRVDILASPVQGSNKVKSIYMEERINRQDTLVIKKLFWTSRKQFEIFTTVQPPHQTATLRQLKVVWDN
jgi:hypothetical protein